MDVGGQIPEELWTLTYLSYLNLGYNFLTGSLSPSIGNLTNLQYLGLSMNALSGEVPKELGLLSQLSSLYFLSNNFSGPLPPELGNLTKLEIFYASDNELTGKIPHFIGTWSNLINLALQGNSFQGPIPSTLANLTSLVQLELRNNDIAGTIPSSIGKLTQLKHLDLSFNKLNGPIPDSLFNMDSLIYLFLGNNSLNSTLPWKISSSLLNIDLSYNNFAGSIPFWVWTAFREIFHVIEIDPFVSRDSNFGVNCGGEQITSSDGVVYEKDDETLGPATHFVTRSKRWAVSNVGRFQWNDSHSYISTSSSHFTNTLDSELFQTARLSASSLRYYGLGLQNGNYTVKLHFAETAFENPRTWTSLGKRIFDIYIQGNRVIQNFDIRKEAGGISFKVVLKEFKVVVSQNYLEIHLFWAGKGTCCIPEVGNYGPSISAISATQDFTPTVSNISPSLSNKKSRTSLIVGITVGVVILSFMSILVAFYLIQIRKKSQMKDDDDEFLGIDVKPLTFRYAELKTATNDFDSSNKLGEGGFGPVYKGTLEDGRVIAVKQLSLTSNQGKSQFVAEIATISAVQHRNLVKLYGCCIEGDKRLLVYEYLENKSLDQALYGMRIMHLLLIQITMTVFQEPKVTLNITNHVTAMISGYLAPEYAMLGHLTEKTDVFAFGVVALEILTGRTNSEPDLGEEKAYLLEWAWNLHEEGREIDLVDSKLSEFVEQEVRRIIQVAFLCTRASPTTRPSMSKVVTMLSVDTDVDTEFLRPSYLVDWKYNDVSSLMS
ncbi:hypothetical protein CsatB_018459 [Cannabis sativa]